MGSIHKFLKSINYKDWFYFIWCKRFINRKSYWWYYKKDSYSFTLSLEPLIITKKHLLSSYDDFIFTYKEKSKDNQLTLAFQCIKNDVTAINEYSLFPLNDNCDSKELCGSPNKQFHNKTLCKWDVPFFDSMDYKI